MFDKFFTTRSTGRRWVPATLLAGGFALGIGAGVAFAHDERLDTATAALQQARSLLLISQSGLVSNKTQHIFDRKIGQAIDAIDKAIGDIAEAAAAVDADSGAQ